MTCLFNYNPHSYAINNKINEISAKIVCAHEIGHDRFHRCLGITMFQVEMCVSLKTSTPEIQANYFAAEFLIPDYSFLELVSQNFTYSQKAGLLNKKGYKLNIPYMPKANFLGNM